MFSQAHRRASLKLARAAIAATIITIATVPSAIAANGIDTTSAWDGHNGVSLFGVPNAASFGQTITIGAGLAPLKSFSFKVGYCSGNVPFRGHIYAWDDATGRATGSSLFDSPTQTLAPTFDYYTLTFTPDTAISLPAGKYVLFASTSEDQTDTSNRGCFVGIVDDTTYTGGSFFFENNGPDTSQWTNSTWASFIHNDMAFAVEGLTEVTTCSFDTLGPGDWHGHHNAARLATVMGSPLVIGSTFTYTFSSAAAVQAFLPGGGKPESISASVVDPAKEQTGNALAAELLALALNVREDAALGDADLAADAGGRRDVAAYFTANDLQTVNELLLRAHKVFGGQIPAGKSELEGLKKALQSVNDSWKHGAERKKSVLACDNAGN